MTAIPISFVVESLVAYQEIATREALVAELASEWLLLGVRSLMALQVLQSSKHALTAVALEALGLLWSRALGLGHIVPLLHTVAQRSGWRVHAGGVAAAAVVRRTCSSVLIVTEDVFGIGASSLH